MDLTLEEKQEIVFALQEAYGHLPNQIYGAVCISDVGVRFEGEIKESLAKSVEQHEAVLNIEKKIYASLEDKEESKALLDECEESIEVLQEWKEALDITSHDGESETPEWG